MGSKWEINRYCEKDNLPQGLSKEKLRDDNEITALEDMK